MLVIIIVSWNVQAMLERCLESLYGNATSMREQRIVVVDNASTDGSVDMIHSRFETVDVIASPNNLGFTGGNNAGLRRAEKLIAEAAPSSSYVMLLNPDTVVAPGALDALLAYADAHPDVGVVGPQLRHGDGSIQSSRRRFPSLLVMMFESTWLQGAAPGKLLDDYYFADRKPEEVCDVDWMVGAALVVRYEAYCAVGGLDAVNFFMYSEETDWCRRIKQAGWRVAYVPDAQITHYEGASSSQVSGQRMRYFNRSKVRYVRKHIGRPQAAWLALWLMGQFTAQCVLEFCKLVAGHKPGLRRNRLRAYCAVLRALWRA